MSYSIETNSDRERVEFLELVIKELIDNLEHIGINIEPDRRPIQQSIPGLINKYKLALEIIYEHCEDCNGVLTQCGELSPDGEPTLDCKECQLRETIDQLRKELGEAKSKELEMYELMKHRMDQRDESEQREKQWRKMADELAKYVTIPYHNRESTMRVLANYRKLKRGKL